MTTCGSCRRPIDDDAAFCPHCGHSMEAAARRARVLRSRRRSRWSVAVLAVVLAVSLGLRFWSGRETGGRELVEPDLVTARSAIAAADWSGAIRALSPTGEAPPGAEARRLLAEALHERCLAQAGAGFERAARARELSLADEPTDLKGLRARAELESSFGRPWRAASWWDVALAESERRAGAGPSHEDLLLDAAVARALAGESLRAELLLEQVLALEPGHARALTNRGLLHLRERRFALAEVDLQAALAREPGLLPARSGLVELARLRAGDTETAAAALRDDAGASVMAQHVLALLAEASGDVAEARRRLDLALELAPGERRLQAARLALESGRP